VSDKKRATLFSNIIVAFHERFLQFLANVHVRYMSSAVRLSVVCLSVVCRLSVVCSLSSVVCRLSSVTFVHSTHVIEIFGSVSTPCDTLAIRDLCIKILPRSSQGNPLVEELNPRGVAEYSDFGPFQGYISETVQDII